MAITEPIMPPDHTTTLHHSAINRSINEIDTASKIHSIPFHSISFQTPDSKQYKKKYRANLRSDQ